MYKNQSSLSFDKCEKYLCVVQPMPKGDHVLNFSDAEDMISDKDLMFVLANLILHTFLVFIYIAFICRVLMLNYIWQRRKPIWIIGVSFLDASPVIQTAVLKH